MEMGRIGGDLKDRTRAFALDVLSALTDLPHDQRGWVIGKQIGRSATSIGANVWEADAAFSESDFAHKISIARKEASETMYWIELILGGELLPKSHGERLLKEAQELTKILTAVLRKTQQHIQSEKEKSRN